MSFIDDLMSRGLISDRAADRMFDQASARGVRSIADRDVVPPVSLDERRLMQGPVQPSSGAYSPAELAAHRTARSTLREPRIIDPDAEWNVATGLGSALLPMGGAAGAVARPVVAAMRAAPRLTGGLVGGGALAASTSRTAESEDIAKPVETDPEPLDVYNSPEKKQARDKDRAKILKRLEDHPSTYRDTVAAHNRADADAAAAFRQQHDAWATRQRETLASREAETRRLAAESDAVARLPEEKRARYQALQTGDQRQAFWNAEMEEQRATDAATAREQARVEHMKLPFAEREPQTAEALRWGSVGATALLPPLLRGMGQRLENSFVRNWARELSSLNQANAGSLTRRSVEAARPAYNDVVKRGEEYASKSFQPSIRPFEKALRYNLPLLPAEATYLYPTAQDLANPHTRDRMLDRMKPVDAEGLVNKDFLTDIGKVGLQTVLPLAAGKIGEKFIPRSLPPTSGSAAATQTFREREAAVVKKEADKAAASAPKRKRTTARPRASRAIQDTTE